MRITVDLRCLTGHPWSGVPVYARSLVRALLRQYPDHEWNGYTSGRRAHPVMIPGLSTVTHERASTALRLLSGWWPRSGRLGTHPADVVFLPNWNAIPPRLDAPIVLTVHDLWPMRLGWDGSWKERWWHRAIRIPQIIERAARIICVSGSTEEELLHFFPSTKGRTRVVRSAPPPWPRHECPSQCRWKQKIKPRVVVVGDRHERKNMDAVLKALAQSSSSYEVVTVGAQALSPLGYQAILAHSDGVVYASLYEGFGFPPQEALDRGIPVVVSSIPAHWETVGDQGILVNPLDWRQLKQIFDEGWFLHPRAPAPRGSRSWQDVAIETMDVLNQGASL